MPSEQDLVGFVREHIRSVWALELLLLLRQSPERSWTVAELVRELRGSTGLVIANLQAIQRSALATQDADGRYRFAPATAALEELCGLLASAYRERPVAIVNLIAQPRDPLQSLAEAFRFKRGDGE